MQANESLIEAKNVLQQLADRDSLTGLANRRALPGVFRKSYDTGATILFFDLNGFKEINDSFGHHAGDVCLQRFAQSLQESFRPDDSIIRYAGDEFVVVAHAVEPSQMRDCIDRVRERLRTHRGDAPPVRFSVGSAYLSKHGDADAALRAADEAMYLDKMGQRC